MRQHYDGHNGKSLNSALGNKPRKSKKNKENQSPVNQTSVWIEKHSISYSENVINNSQELSGSNMQSRIERLEEQLDNMAFVVINQSKEISGLRNVLHAGPPEQRFVSEQSLQRQPMGILKLRFQVKEKNRTI